MGKFGMQEVCFIEKCVELIKVFETLEETRYARGIRYCCGILAFCLFLCESAQAQAQSAKQIQTCPDCGSTNYMSVANAAPRCYDCGYPLSQSGSKFGSLTGAKIEGNVRQSLGNDTQNNYNPQNIIGRIE